LETNDNEEPSRSVKYSSNLPKGIKSSKKNIIDKPSKPDSKMCDLRKNKHQKAET